MSKQLLILPKSAGLTLKDKQRLHNAGFLALELEDPGSARLLSPDGAEISQSAMLTAAMRAMVESNYDSRVGVQSTFVKLLVASLKSETQPDAVGGSHADPAD